MLRSGFLFVICENDMLWSGNLGLKMGLQKWHIPNMHIIYASAPGILDIILTTLCTRVCSKIVVTG